MKLATPADLYINPALKEFIRAKTFSDFEERISLRPESDIFYYARNLTLDHIPEEWPAQIIMALARTLPTLNSPFSASLTLRITGEGQAEDELGIHIDGGFSGYKSPFNKEWYFLACCTDIPGNLTLVDTRKSHSLKGSPRLNQLAPIEPNRFHDITDAWHAAPTREGLSDPELDEKLFLRVVIQAPSAHRTYGMMSELTR